jgi:hypothetical protein
MILMLEVIKVFVVVVIGFIAWRTTGIDFPTICFYIDIAITLYNGFIKIRKITIRKSTFD